MMICWFDSSIVIRSGEVYACTLYKEFEVKSFFGVLAAPVAALAMLMGPAPAASAATQSLPPVVDVINTCYRNYGLPWMELGGIALNQSSQPVTIEAYMEIDGARVTNSWAALKAKGAGTINGSYLTLPAKGHVVVDKPVFKGSHRVVIWFTSGEKLLRKMSFNPANCRRAIPRQTSQPVRPWLPYAGTGQSSVTGTA